jgi:DNA (cytosine-5)-methyltransferase 1
MDQRNRLRSLHLFAGAGGGLLWDLLLGHRPVCAVEIDPYCQRILRQRQADGWLPWFPIWDDVRDFDGKPWRGSVDIVAGGFPCQEISDAGKRHGISGARSGLWTEFARIIGDVRPRYAFIENTAALAHRGLDRVLADLAALGMDARWCCLGADDVGAPHIRKRLWILAYAPGEPMGSPGQSRHDRDVGHPNGARLAVGQGERGDACQQQSTTERTGWWESEPDVGRVAARMANAVDRLTAIGNGWVPHCAALAWRILTLESAAERR